MYRTREEQPETERATRAAKKNFSILSKEKSETKEKSFIAAKETGEDGSFDIPIKDNQITKEDSIEIDVYIERAPGQQERPEDVDPLQFTVDVVNPTWEESEQGLTAEWSHCISQRYWCKIREKLGAWAICGRVAICSEEEK